MTASVSRDAGGLYQSVRGLAQSSNTFNRHVSVFGIQDEFTVHDLEAWAPLSVRTFPTWGLRRFSFAPGMSRALMECNVDLIQLHGLWRYTSVIANRWHRLTGKPYIVHPHGMLDPWAVKNAHWKKLIAGFLFENRMLRGAACIRALCQSEAESIRRYGLKNPICIIPNGMSLPAGPYAEPAWRSHLPADAKILFYLGRIHPKKGLPNLLRAWKSVVSQKTKGNEKWILVIAGWDEKGHEQELMRLASELGLQWSDTRMQSQSNQTGERSVFFVGPQFKRAKADCYHHCDAFILPSFSEGLPMVVLEAWSHGKPVIMTPECNLPEGFVSNAALKIEANAESIAQGINQLFALPATELDQLGQNGLHLTIEKFAWKKIALDLNNVCLWVLNEGPKPECIYPS